ncbi:MAG: hypothetical protein HGB19_01290 [Chlorobiales bacterium]|jgi:hypothetical protein|nr:hypothetical protein [Chlorobiales bacterium]
MYKQILALGFLLTTFFIHTADSVAQAPYTASSRLYHVQEGQLMRKGMFSFSTTGSFFTKSNDYLNPVTGETRGLSIYNSDIALDYAATDNVTMSVSTTALQSAFPRNSDGTYTDLFNELRFGVKVGSLETFERALQIGGLITTTIPLNRSANRPFVPFASGTLDLGFLMIGSYYFDNILPEESISAHLNLGVEYYFSGTNRASRSGTAQFIPDDAVSLRYGLGFSVPIEQFRVFAELSGEAFVAKRLPAYVYSREDYIYAGIGVGWQPISWFGIEALGEFLVSGGKNDNTTIYKTSIGVDQLSKSGINYSPYKISGGLKFTFGKSFTLFADVNDVDTLLSNQDRGRNQKIRRILNARSQDLIKIYQNAREADETLEGSLYFDITIGKDGSTKDARILVSTFNETRGGVYLEKEMLDEVKKWRYPSGDKELQIEILRLHFGPKNTTLAEEKK